MSEPRKVEIQMPATEITLEAAVEAFFVDKDLARNSRRTYRQTLDALVEDHTSDLPVVKLTPAKIRRTLENRWGRWAPSTWNSRMTALQSFIGYCNRDGWFARDPLRGIERKREPRDSEQGHRLRRPRRSVVPGRCQSEGEDAVADAVRKLRLGPTRSWPSTSRTSTSAPSEPS